MRSRKLERQWRRSAPKEIRERKWLELFPGMPQTLDCAPRPVWIAFLQRKPQPEREWMPRRLLSQHRLLRLVGSLILFFETIFNNVGSSVLFRILNCIFLSWETLPCQLRLRKTFSSSSVSRKKQKLSNILTTFLELG